MNSYLNGASQRDDVVRFEAGCAREQAPIDLGFHGKLMQTLRHDATCGPVVFLHDSQYVVTTSLDCTIKVWHIMSGRQAYQINVPGPVDAAIVAFDGEAAEKFQLQQQKHRMWQMRVLNETLLHSTQSHNDDESLHPEELHAPQLKRDCSALPQAPQLNRDRSALPKASRDVVTPPPQVLTPEECAARRALAEAQQQRQRHARDKLDKYSHVVGACPYDQLYDQLYVAVGNRVLLLQFVLCNAAEVGTVAGGTASGSESNPAQSLQSLHEAESGQQFRPADGNSISLVMAGYGQRTPRYLIAQPGTSVAEKVPGMYAQRRRMVERGVMPADVQKSIAQGSLAPDFFKMLVSRAAGVVARQLNDNMHRFRLTEIAILRLMTRLPDYSPNEILKALARPNRHSDTLLGCVLTGHGIREALGEMGIKHAEDRASGPTLSSFVTGVQAQHKQNQQVQQHGFRMFQLSPDEIDSAFCFPKTPKRVTRQPEAESGMPKKPEEIMMDEKLLFLVNLAREKGGPTQALQTFAQEQAAQIQAAQTRAAQTQAAQTQAAQTQARKAQQEWKENHDRTQAIIKQMREKQLGLEAQPVLQAAPPPPRRQQRQQQQQQQQHFPLAQSSMSESGSATARSHPANGKPKSKKAAGSLTTRNEHLATKGPFALKTPAAIAATLGDAAGTALGTAAGTALGTALGTAATAATLGYAAGTATPRFGRRSVSWSCMSSPPDPADTAVVVGDLAAAAMADAAKTLQDSAKTLQDSALPQTRGFAESFADRYIVTTTIPHTTESEFEKRAAELVGCVRDSPFPYATFFDCAPERLGGFYCYETFIYGQPLPPPASEKMPSMVSRPRDLARRGAPVAGGLSGGNGVQALVQAEADAKVQAATRVMAPVLHGQESSLQQPKGGTKKEKKVNIVAATRKVEQLTKTLVQAIDRSKLRQNVEEHEWSNTSTMTGVKNVYYRYEEYEDKVELEKFLGFAVNAGVGHLFGQQYNKAILGCDLFFETEAQRKTDLKNKCGMARRASSGIGINKEQDQNELVARDFVMVGTGDGQERLAEGPLMNVAVAN